MAKKICKNCLIFVEGSVCPICKGNQFADSYKGKIYVFNPEKSQVAKKAEIKEKGEYAIRI